MLPDFRHRTAAQRPRWRLLSALALSALTGLSACAITAPPPPDAAPTAPAVAPSAPTSNPAEASQTPRDAAAADAASSAATPTTPPPNPAYIARRELVQQPLRAVLGYADKIRVLSVSEVAREIGRLSPLAEQADPEVQPQRQLQLALALAQTRSTPDLVRAIGLTQRVQETQTPVTRELQPLARLLQQRYTEQRRVEDLNDRQGQLLRETQRRLDAAQERMEALKAIERSLYNNHGRPGAVGAGMPPAPTAHTP